MGIFCETEVKQAINLVLVEAQKVVDVHKKKWESTLDEERTMLNECLQQSSSTTLNMVNACINDTNALNDEWENKYRLMNDGWQNRDAHSINTINTLIVVLIIFLIVILYLLYKFTRRTSPSANVIVKDVEVKQISLKTP